MKDDQIAEATEKLVHCIGEKSEFIGWRIAQEIANINADTSEFLNELVSEISKINLNLTKVNGNLKKIAEKKT